MLAGKKQDDYKPSLIKMTVRCNFDECNGIYVALAALYTTRHKSNPPKCYLCIRHERSSGSLLTHTFLKLSFKSVESRRQLEDQPLQRTQCAGCQSGPSPSGQTVQVAEWK